MDKEMENAKAMAQQIFDYKKKIEQLQAESKELETKLKSYMSTNAINEMEAENLLVTLKNCPETFIADTEALKRDGIFDKYSKIKKGYVSLTIKEKK